MCFRKSSFCSHLVVVLSFDGVLPVGLCSIGVWRRAPHRHQSVAQVDRLLIVWGGRWRGGAEVQGRAQAVLRHLSIRSPTIRGVPTHGQNLRGGQGWQPVSTAALWRVVVWQREDTDTEMLSSAHNMERVSYYEGRETPVLRCAFWNCEGSGFRGQLSG